MCIRDRPKEDIVVLKKVNENEVKLDKINPGKDVLTRHVLSIESINLQRYPYKNSMLDPSKQPLM